MKGKALFIKDLENWTRVALFGLGVVFGGLLGRT